MADTADSYFLFYLGKTRMNQHQTNIACLSKQCHLLHLAIFHFYASCTVTGEFFYSTTKNGLDYQLNKLDKNSCLSKFACILSLKLI